LNRGRRDVLVSSSSVFGVRRWVVVESPLIVVVGDVDVVSPGLMSVVCGGLTL